MYTVELNCGFSSIIAEIAWVQLLHSGDGDSGEALKSKADMASTFCVALHIPLNATAFPAIVVRMSQ
jgi:hypothetical protein